MPKIINFGQKKSEQIQDKKRSLERLILNDFLGCSAALDKHGSHYPLKLVDISYDGCMIQIPTKDMKSKLFEVGKELDLRFYFTESSYIPLSVEIKHVNEHQEANKFVIRIGCQFDKSTKSFAPMQSFIDFLYKYSECSLLDKGDNKVYFL